MPEECHSHLPRRKVLVGVGTGLALIAGGAAANGSAGLTDSEAPDTDTGSKGLNSRDREALGQELSHQGGGGPVVSQLRPKSKIKGWQRPGDGGDANDGGDKKILLDALEAVPLPMLLATRFGFGISSDAAHAATGRGNVGRPLDSLTTAPVGGEDIALLTSAGLSTAASDWSFGDVEAATLVRRVHSRHQLHELMVDFWHQTFHTDGKRARLAGDFAAFDLTLRRHALGNLEALVADLGTRSAARAVADLDAVARRLVVRWLDRPERQLVQLVSQALAEGTTDGHQIASAIRAAGSSQALEAGWGQGGRRPDEVVIATLRRLGVNVDLATARRLLDRRGKDRLQLFPTPASNGITAGRRRYASTGARAASWRLVAQLPEVLASAGQPLSQLVEMPADVRSAIQVADFWLERLLARPVAERHRLAIVDFLADGREPERTLPAAALAGRDGTLEAIVGLILMSPYSQWK